MRSWFLPQAVNERSHPRRSDPKTHRLATLIAAATMASISPARAGTFNLISATKQVAVVLMSDGAIRRGSLQEFWVEYVYPSTQPDGTDYVIAQERLDCQLSTIMAPFTSRYSLTQTSPINIFRDPAPKSLPIPPGTVNDAMRSWYCLHNGKAVDHQKVEATDVSGVAHEMRRFFESPFAPK